MQEQFLAPYYNAVQEFQSALLRFWLLPQDIAKFSLRLEDTEEILRGAPPESAEGVSQRIEVICDKNSALMKEFFGSVFLSEGRRDAIFQRFGCPQSEQSVQEYIERSETWGGYRFFLTKDDVTIGCCEAYPTQNEGEVEILYIIHPDYQKQGYGRTLLVFAMEYLKEHGISSLFAQPTHTDSEAFFGHVVTPRGVSVEGRGSYGEKNRELVASL